VITRLNVPDAAIISYEDYVKFKRMQAYLGIVRISQQLHGSGLNAREIYEESRRELEERGEREPSATLASRYRHSFPTKKASR